MKIKVKAEAGAVIPKYETGGAAGFDFRSIEALTLLPKQRAIVGTGLYFEIEEGYEVQVRSRSGNAAKYGIAVLNSPGTIDSDYRGEVKIILYNSSDIAFEINVGDRVAQGVVQKVEQATFENSVELSETERGEGGLGSTGLK